MSLVPYRDTRRPRRRQPLDQAQVVRAALALMDEVGLDGVNMRALAAKLGVKAASLYRHVKDKEELLILMADELSAEIPPETQATGWREALREAAHRYRRALLRHRDAARLMAATMPAGPRRLQHVEAAMKMMLDAGLSDADAARAAYHFNNFVNEFAADEARAEAAARQMGVSKKKLTELGRRMFRQLPASDFPTLTRLADQIVDGDMDGLFEFGLEVWLSGLERRRRPDVSRPARRSPAAPR